MESEQYEELCRHFLSKELGIPLLDIESKDIWNPRRPGLTEFKHEIDLYWETEDRVSHYVNIANAKWRTSDKVDQPDVLLLQQVRQSVGAHKAVIITNSGFTRGAIAAAEHHGIGLHKVTASFDVSRLPRRDRGAIQSKLAELAGSADSGIYSHDVVVRAFANDRQAEGFAKGSIDKRGPTRRVSRGGAVRPGSVPSTRSGGGGGRTAGGSSHRGRGGFSRA